MLLGLTADVYRHGAAFWLEIISLVLFCIATNYVYLPVFHKLKVATVYEYLELRFDRKIRQLTSSLFTTGIVLYLPLAIYTSALTFSAVTGLKLYVAVPIVSGICIFYTSIGGFRTVVWTDTLQFLSTIVALFIVCILGLKSVGFAEVWTKALNSGHLDIFDFDPDPTKRDSFWIIVIGVTILSMSYTTVDQTFMQKMLALKTYRDASLAVIYYAIGMSVLHSICILIGLVMHAKYADCDPFTMKIIERNDQMLPYYVMDVAKNVPGLPGIFVAGTFGTSLSLQSAFLNCLSGVVYSDFLSKFMSRNISEKKVTNILKLTVVTIGIVCTILVFVINSLGSAALFPVIVSFIGAICGPILGVFTMGLLFPKANSKGAFYGIICGILCTFGILIPAKYYEFKGMVNFGKSVSTEGCTSNSSFVNETTSYNFVSNNNSDTLDPVPAIFRISFYYYSVIGVVVAVAVGSIISCMTNKNDRPVKRNLISPVCRFLLPKEENFHNVEEALQMSC